MSLRAGVLSYWSYAFTPGDLELGLNINQLEAIAGGDRARLAAEIHEKIEIKRTTPRLQAPLLPILLLARLLAMLLARLLARLRRGRLLLPARLRARLLPRCCSCKAAGAAL